ncbi:MAG TPA: c-type cytochrome [Vicinamibacterales bacterium]|nr:c-type cytochrome [Vicinamibacterales bacterium]
MIQTALVLVMLAQAAPWKGENLQVFPKDISRAELTQRMREFSFALGVRCQYCHAGGNGVTFEGVSFSSDEKPAKVKARTMLQMVDQINNVALAKLASRAEPRVTVDCATCHRGVSVPKSLQTTLFEIVQAQGAPAAATKYRELRKDESLGRYNFGEWEMNELARRLTEAGNRSAAIAMLELNGEFYPKSADIDALIGEQYRALGDKAKAIEKYRAALAKSPDHGVAKQRLAEMEKQQ